eukprot:TRINITY_DN32907_c0_g1_i1.p1 TRINITY_DN32907_c0_g1~~TRINITY_DN32907_c0_g1_i1.p1  ORF type:complete len:513 (-),score=64.23 TRINITY_DN32907_c0_g1_i1:97-1635(-)
MLMPVDLALAASLLLGPSLLVDATGSASRFNITRTKPTCKETRGALLLQTATANATDQSLQLIAAGQRLMTEDHLQVLRLLCFPLLALFCFWYEVWQPLSINKIRQQAAAVSKSSLPTPKKQRLPVWDIVRFILELWVICHHMPGGSGGLMSNGHSPLDAWNRLFLPMRMPAFSMLSGMFGSSLTRESLSKMFCYTFGTCLLASMLYTWEPGHGLNLEKLSSGHMLPTHLWYLGLIPFWRLIITPLFHLMREKLKMPALVPFIATYVMLYFTRHSCLEVYYQKTDAPNAFSVGALIVTKTHVGNFAFFGTFFALGLCMPASSWAQGLLQAWTPVAALMLLGIYWTRYCNTSLDPFDGGHFPMYMQDDSISIKGFMKDSLLMQQATCLTLSVLAVIAHFSVILQRYVPKVCEFIASCGSRTLYAYVLHPLFIQTIQSAVTWETCEKPVSAMMTIAFAMIMNVVLCTSGSELLFRWMLLPYWMLDVGPWFIGSFLPTDTDPTKWTRLRESNEKT